MPDSPTHPEAIRPEEFAVFKPDSESTVHRRTRMDYVGVKKLDVDGNEAKILRGMSGLLASDQRPRAIQVEVGPRNQAEVYAVLAQFGYGFESRNFTAKGKQLLAENPALDPNSILHNVLFVQQATQAHAA